jgi:hypothetical protein
MYIFFFRMHIQIPADQLKPGDRDSAKRVVYAVIYGIGKEQLGAEYCCFVLAMLSPTVVCHTAEQLSKTVKEAESFMKSFLAKYFWLCFGCCHCLPPHQYRYPGVARFQAACISMCTKHGYVQTIFNRKRSFPKIKSTEVCWLSFGNRFYCF